MDNSLSSKLADSPNLPIFPPGKIICVGMNYPALDALPADMPYPVLFLKASSIVIGLDNAIQIPRAAKRCSLRVKLRL